MGVGTLRREKKRPLEGSTLWHNPTNRPVLIRMRDGKYEANKQCSPGGEVNLPAALSDKVVKSLAPQLVKGAAPIGKAKPPPPPKPAPIEAPEPELGDASAPRTVTDDDGREVDSERSSDDALEVFAQELSEKKHKELQDIAESLGVATGGRKIDIARRIAKKSSE